MGKVRANNLDFHVQQMNKEASETIILITGLLGNIAQWYFSLAPILATKYHVIMFDLKGHGKTQKVTKGYDLESMSNDVLGIMNALEIDSAHIIGFSYGAQVALKFVINYPDRCNCLVVMESPNPKNSIVYKVMEQFNITSLEQVKHKLPSYVIDKVNNKIKTDKQEVSRSTARIIKTTMRVYEYLCLHTTLVCDLYYEPEFDEIDLHKIKADTLLIFGSESDCITEAIKLNKWIPKNRLVITEGGHWYPVENPNLVGNEIFNFLKDSIFKCSEELVSI